MTVSTTNKKRTEMSCNVIWYIKMKAHWEFELLDAQIYANCYLCFVRLDRLDKTCCLKRAVKTKAKQNSLKTKARSTNSKK